MPRVQSKLDCTRGIGRNAFFYLFAGHVNEKEQYGKRFSKNKGRTCGTSIVRRSKCSVIQINKKKTARALRTYASDASTSLCYQGANFVEEDLKIWSACLDSLFFVGATLASN